MHRLERPHEITGLGAQRHHRIGMLVVAGALAAEESGLGEEVGRNTRPSASSTDIGAQTLASPASMPSCTKGSHDQRGRPLRASNARTVPSGASTRTLSASDDPTTTTPRPTTGAEVIWTSPGHNSGLPASSLTSPPAPKSVQGMPDFASSAMTRASLVPMKMRERQAASAAASSRQYATPRQT